MEKKIVPSSVNLLLPLSEAVSVTAVPRALHTVCWNQVQTTKAEQIWVSYGLLDEENPRENRQTSSRNQHVSKAN